MLLRQRGPSLVVDTPAKLNLFLEILAKRSDGFHELETLMVSVGIYDTLTFTEDDSDRIRLRQVPAGPSAITLGTACEEIPSGVDNLIVRAAELLRDHAGIGRGICIDLRKRIPVSAGLAGGSSNAAATLWALNRFWNLGLSAAQLGELASQLGSDVNFFLCGAEAAVCHGRGEIVSPLSLPASLHFVVVRPQSGLATATVFRHCHPSAARRDVRPLIESLREGRLGRAAGSLYNALQTTAEQLSFDVVTLKDRFSQLPVLGHLMSGSGTAYFGLCANKCHAQLVAARLRAMRLGTVFVAQSGP